MNKSKLLIFGSVIFLTSVFITACDKKVAKLTPETPPVALSACETVSFAKDIEPIIKANCLGCHNASFSTANYTTYEGVKEKALNGTLKARVIDASPPASMPKGGEKLSKDKLDLIQCWIDNGAKP